MTSALISCVVRVFNVGGYVGEALESALDQTHRPTEIVVVDDGSTDGTPGILAAYG